MDTKGDDGSEEAFEEMKQVEAALHETSDVQDDLCLDESSAAANGDAGNFNAAEEEVVPDIDLTAGGNMQADAKTTNKDEKIDSSGGPEDPLKMPPHGTEVYIGGIAKSATDAQIGEFCATAGEVFSLRCTKDPGIPGKNRGYAFVTYKTTDQATSAVDKLNNGELKDFPGKTVRVILSQVKNRLFIGNVPKDLKLSDIQEVLRKEVRGVIDVELLMDREQSMNRGFCFVEFYNHSAADLARKILSRPDFRLKDRILTVTWAEPKKVDSDQEQIKSIYVGNLPESVTEAKLRDVFKAYGEVEKVVLPSGLDDRRFREYGFVHYTERACALKAIEAAEEEKPTLDNAELTVAMAKPPTQSRDPIEATRRLSNSLVGGSRLGMGGLGVGLVRGRDRPMPPRVMGYGTDFGFSEMEQGYGAYASAAPGGYNVPGLALVPMYLPNGQVGFVFQHQASGMMPGSGGPVRGFRTGDIGSAVGRTYGPNRSDERADHGGPYGGPSRYSRSNPRHLTGSRQNHGSSSRYRPY